MARLVWDAFGSRIYEAGVDRGVLYVDGKGYPWNGIVSISEDDESEPRDHYVDGVKYANLATFEDYSATLVAYSTPPEFIECNGGKSLGNGLIATQQRRKHFGFSYRTLIGNDIQGERYGYHLHIVYNAIAIQESYEATTIGDSAEPVKTSWKITTRPPSNIYYHRPTAHYKIDSRTTPPDLLAQVEQSLYGANDVEPYLMSADDLIYKFTHYGDTLVVHAT